MKRRAGFTPPYGLARRNVSGIANTHRVWFHCLNGGRTRYAEPPTLQLADLEAGDRLLNDDASWAEVASVRVEAAPLEAFNLTVSDYSTYFVAANVDAAPVWVHNAACRTKFGDFSSHYTDHGHLAGMTRKQYRSDAFAHSREGGAEWSGAYRHKGETRVAHVTRIGDDQYSLTTTTKSGNRIYTHMPEGKSAQYLRNNGITLPPNMRD